MSKTRVIFEDKNPFQEGVSYIAINARENLPYVFQVYVGRKADVPKLPEDLVVLPIAQARNLFDFRQGKINRKISRTDLSDLTQERMQRD
ncbi:hypothetical protein HZA97_00865 [Candidatus Woesearchaeota archaeon]|nr:hypothetical protein [Candidatus Woesearchaeota archaeon]